MLDSYAYGMWLYVLINAGIIIFFTLGYLKPKRRWEWRSMGAFGAFTVALFTEMYGFPLTIYLLTSALGSRYPVTNPFAHSNGNLWSVLLGGSEIISGLLMFLGSAVIIAGIVVMARAWKQIYTAGGKLVTNGFYRRVRHPQYTALFLITLGMFIQWPTLVSIAIWPVLMFMYYRLAIREEKEIEATFGDSYRDYKRQVPMFFPRFNDSKKRLTA